MAKYSILVAQFPENRGLSYLHPTKWIGRLLAKLEQDDDCHNVTLWDKTGGDTPITMLRNLCLVDADRLKMDFVLMVDSDNSPDLYLGIDPEAKPFYDSSINFMRNHPGPCVVAAPYCGGPPDESVHAFRWVNHTTNDANPDFALKTLTRYEAGQMRGILPCAAAATGVMIIDMRGVKKLDHPRFAYEWKDFTESVKATTEDVYFTRNCNYAGIPTYINWDAWAGHVKTKMVGRPIPIHTGSITRQIRRAAKEQLRDGTLDKSQSQEEPIRVRATNTYAELPPTINPDTVTPAGMSVLQAADGPLKAWFGQSERQMAVAVDRQHDEPDGYVDATGTVRQSYEAAVLQGEVNPVEVAKDNGEYGEAP